MLGHKAKDIIKKHLAIEQEDSVRCLSDDDRCSARMALDKSIEALADLEALQSENQRLRKGMEAALLIRDTLQARHGKDAAIRAMISTFDEAKEALDDLEALQADVVSPLVREPKAMGYETIRKIFEMTQAELMEAIDACQPQPLLSLSGGVNIESPYERVNRFWKSMGEKYGFVWHTVKLICGKSATFFSADIKEK